MVKIRTRFLKVCTLSSSAILIIIFNLLPLEEPIGQSDAIVFKGTSYVLLVKRVCLKIYSWSSHLLMLGSKINICKE